MAQALAPQIDELRRDLDWVYQGTRIVLLGCVTLATLYASHADAHTLDRLTIEAVPVILAALNAAVGAQLARPVMTAASIAMQDAIIVALTGVLGASVSAQLAAHVVGEAPPLLSLTAHFIAENIIGIYPSGQNAFLIRMKPNWGSYLIGYLVDRQIRSLLASHESGVRMFLDRRIRGGKGKGKEGNGKGGGGKGKDKGKGRGGKGNAKGKGKGKGKGKDLGKDNGEVVGAPVVVVRAPAPDLHLQAEAAIAVAVAAAAGP